MDAYYELKKLCFSPTDQRFVAMGSYGGFALVFKQLHIQYEQKECVQYLMLCACLAVPPSTFSLKHSGQVAPKMPKLKLGSADTAEGTVKSSLK